MPAFAFAIGLPTLSRSGSCIDCFFPAPLKAPDGALDLAIRDHFSPGEAMVEPDAASAFIDAHQPQIAPLLEADRPLVVALLPEDLDLLSGTMVLRDKEGNLVGEFRIDGGDVAMALEAIDLSRIDE